jgi:methylmalonyl-CoA mutase N-terminal domain/subunit
MSDSLKQKADLKKSKDSKDWRENHYGKLPQRQGSFVTVSGKEIPGCVLSEDLDPKSTSERIPYPGEFPYTRGIHATMYRGKLWTMRQFAGFGTPENTNQRFHYLLQHGQTGLSTAFDMPTLMGYDPDHPLSTGEVGREGVSVPSMQAMERLFAGIDLTAVTTSMTINCSAAPMLAMYFALARRRGYDWNLLGGTIQNDILKEYIAQKEWICPPGPGVRVVCDMIEFCTDHATRFHPVSISGYHIREAGATAVQELAFTLYDGITYVEELLRRGRDIDSFAPRLSFFWDVHNDFFEEIAKFRAARRMWAHLMRDRFGAKDERSMKLKTHAQTAGVSLTAQQPLNNVARVALQALAAVLGGTQSLHTNSMDETLALPTEEAVKVALRTQQILAHETGVAHTVDPLGGSYFIEHLTDTIEKEAWMYIEKLDNLGGMLTAIELGYPQKEIAESAYEYQRAVERGEQCIVGVNAFVDDEGSAPIPIHSVDLAVERSEIELLKKFKADRDQSAVTAHLQLLKDACCGSANLMMPLIDAVDSGVTIGEVSQVFRECFGVYTDPGDI